MFLHVGETHKHSYIAGISIKLPNAIPKMVNKSKTNGLGATTAVNRDAFSKMKSLPLWQTWKI